MSDVLPDPSEETKYTAEDEKSLIKSILAQYEPGTVKGNGASYRVKLREKPGDIPSGVQAAITYNIRMMGLHVVKRISYNPDAGVIRIHMHV